MKMFMCARVKHSDERCGQALWLVVSSRQAEAQAGRGSAQMNDFNKRMYITD
jgi:hypothetical protein